MDPTQKIGRLLEVFVKALREHDAANPTHTAWGIGMSHFDLERLGFDEGEEILPGIVIQVDGGTTGNFRILCDGDHSGEESEEEEQVVDAISEHEVAEPMYEPALVPGPSAPPRVTPPV
jgi:hypothetical protein